MKTKTLAPKVTPTRKFALRLAEICLGADRSEFDPALKSHYGKRLTKKELTNLSAALRWSARLSQDYLVNEAKKSESAKVVYADEFEEVIVAWRKKSKAKRLETFSPVPKPTSAAPKRVRVSVKAHANAF